MLAVLIAAQLVPIMAHTLPSGQHAAFALKTPAVGAHVLLDYDNFVVDAAKAGKWLLAAISEEVSLAGVTEVHQKLVLLGTEESDYPESLPGFTSVILLDESHVTAHCYSDRGLLAIDVFTCGAHDPSPLANRIHERVIEFAPLARCLQNARAPRFISAGRLGKAISVEFD
mmetsp:Transcript_5957/g.13065  ORF Transcript_5957/g.13065 Transcript_5957/m.13065 type:complete len:171 (+) Transcript_5957:211-723(+)